MTSPTRQEYAALRRDRRCRRGGRVAARGRVPLRAPRRALGARGRRAAHTPEGAARPLPLRLRRGAPLDPRRAARAPRGDGSPTWRPRDAPIADRASRALLADYCLEVQPGQQVVVRSTTLAAPLLLALQARDPRPRRVAAAARRRCPARARAGGPRRATSTSTASRPPTCARRRRPTPRSRSRRRRTRPRWPASTRRGWPARPAPGRRSARRRCAGAGARRTGRRRPPPSRRAWARPSSRPS